MSLVKDLFPSIDVMSTLVEVLFVQCHMIAYLVHSDYYNSKLAGML